MTSVEWLQVGAELVAVFLGVSLSFIVANYRERRAERRAARQALLGLRDDIAAELPAVDWLLEVYGSTAEAAEQLCRNWKDLPEIQERAEEALTKLHAGAPFSPARAHYETLKSQGILGLIENAELRARIAEVFEQQHTYLRGINTFSVQFDFDFFRQIRPYIEYGQREISVGLYMVSSDAPLISRVRFLPGAAERLASDNVARNSLHFLAIFRQEFAELLTAYRKALGELDASIVSAVA